MLALLFAAGAVTVLLHEVFRWPMKMPGRHGLELMAMFLFLRCASGERFAVTLAAIGGVAAGGLLGHGGGVDAVILLLQGLAIDVAYARMPERPWRNYLLPLLAGASHMLKPLVKLLFQAGLGVPTDSLAHGLGYPLATHFAFGCVGGLFGVMAWRGLQKSLRGG